MSREHVLVVDDLSDLRMIMAAHLDSAGYDVGEESSGEGLLAYVATIVPDLIVLDVVMPGIGGLEACRRMRAMPRLNEVRVLFVTCGTDEVMAEACALGADVLQKPFKREELLRRIDRLLGSNRTTEPIRRDHVAWFAEL